ncbi:MAG TPA: Rrf2 family transcriptional regulator [Chitinophagaceae bacterium]|nr:Rrf2 family transcriptional regulator [Chitinophagaceae bacterium]
MFFSKSFGYALRGVLYVSIEGKEGRKIQIEEIAEQLSVPRHFLAKIMKAVVKKGILNSTKGPYGGFSINKKTLNTKLIHLVELTDGTELFNNCILGLKNCNGKNPCPLHDEIALIRSQLLNKFGKTRVGDLTDEENVNFIQSLAVV